MTNFCNNGTVLLILSSSCCNYRLLVYLFKKEFKLEHLLTLLSDHAISLCRFKLCNTNIPVVTGRYFNIDYDDRKCMLCKDNAIGDEFHYIFKWSHFHQLRVKFVEPKFISNCSPTNIFNLYNSQNKNHVINLCKFVKEISSQFRLT